MLVRISAKPPPYFECHISTLSPVGKRPTNTDKSLFDHRPQHDVPEARDAVIALQINRTWPQWIGPERAPGAAENRLVVDDLLAVQDHRGVAIQERDVQRLPLAG